MADASTISPIRVDEAHSHPCRGYYGTGEDMLTDLDERYRLRADADFCEVTVNLTRFDYIIDRIHSLRSGECRGDENRDRGSEMSIIDEPAKRSSESSSRSRHSSLTTLEEGFRFANGGKCFEESFDVDSGSTEGGPIRSQFYAPRDQPYSLSRSPSNRSRSMDRRESRDRPLEAGQDEREGPDQMQIRDTPPAIADFSISHDRWITDETSRKDRLADGPNTANDPTPLPSIVIDDTEEDPFLEILMRDSLQPAQTLPDNSVPGLAPRTWSDSSASNRAIASSRPSSRCSSRAQSPGSAINLESPGTILTSSPLGSPQVTSYRIPAGLSSPSSSNHSFGDIPSPSNYQTPVSQRVEERLSENLGSLPTWRDAAGATEQSEVGIDSSELQLVEEVLRAFGGRQEVAEEAQVVPDFEAESFARDSRANEGACSLRPLETSGSSEERSFRAAASGGPSFRYEAGYGENERSSVHALANSVGLANSAPINVPGDSRSRANRSAPIFGRDELRPLDTSGSSEERSFRAAASGGPSFRYEAGYGENERSSVHALANSVGLATSAPINIPGDSRATRRDHYEASFGCDAFESVATANVLAMDASYSDGSRMSFWDHGAASFSYPFAEQQAKLDYRGTAASYERDFYEYSAATNSVEQADALGERRECGAEINPGPDTLRSSSMRPMETFNEFQLPEMVSSFRSRHAARRSDRNILPWPSLNLPSVKASERLKGELNPKDVEKAMIQLLKRPADELARADEDGDTMLMCLVGNPAELARKKAYLVPLVERLSNVRGALSRMNNRGEDALYLAATNCPHMPYVAGYLAAAMLQKGIDINQKLYHTRGDTLIHSVAARGDSHGEVLAELLALRTAQGHAVFDLSKRNYDGRTALHVAVEAHDSTGRGVCSVATVSLLLENGADPGIKETKCGDTALHMAVSLTCDPALVKALLGKSGADIVNVANYNYNTPLHMAAAASKSASLEKQREVCRLLMHAGAQGNAQNRHGKTPLALVSPERKDLIRRVFHKK